MEIKTHSLLIEYFLKRLKFKIEFQGRCLLWIHPEDLVQAPVHLSMFGSETASYNIHCYFDPVPKLGRAHQCQAGGPPDRPSGERRGGLQGVLQSPPPACGGLVLQLAHTAPTERSVPMNIMLISRVISLRSVSLLHYQSVLPPDSLDPLANPRVCQQRYDMNNRGKICK